MIDLNDPNIPIIGAKPKMTDEEAGNAIMGTLQLLVTLIRDMLPYVEAAPETDKEAQHICSAVYEFLGTEEPA